MTRIPREDLLAEIDRLADGDDPPSATDMRADGEYAEVTYQNRFGSWVAALEAAGYNAPKQQFTAEELIEDLQAFAEELGHSPSSYEMDNDGPHAPHTYRREFGSWDEALAAAGIDPVSRGYSEEELIEELHRLTEELGRVPTSTDIEQHGRMSFTPFMNRWGTIEESLAAAGLDPGPD